MPELPEVEVSRLGIAPHNLEPQTITHVQVWQPRLALANFRRRATVNWRNKSCRSSDELKYLLLETGVGTLILHLGMSGSCTWCRPVYDKQKHDHFALSSIMA